MKLFKIIFIISFISGSLCAQEEKNTDILTFSIGSNFSNLLNAEAPDKTINYNTHLIKNSRIDFLIGFEYEFSLSKSYAFFCGLNYESKGIDLNYENNVNKQDDNSIIYPYHEQLEIIIKNDYLTLPIGIKKYFLNKNWYIKGNVYISYLLKSKGSYFEEFVEKDDNGYIVSFFELISDINDPKKDHTYNIDYGFSLGTGLNFPLNEKLLFAIDYNISIGLRKIDKMYNNDLVNFIYEDPYYGYQMPLNYYELNSNARNISMSLTIGLRCNL